MSTSKKKKVNHIIRTAIVILVFVGILILALVFNRDSKIDPNPSGTVGNSAGNLNNSGLFCEYNNLIYFSNPLDKNRLYTMNPDGSDIKKVLSVPVKYINTAGDYVYYYYDDSDENDKFMGVGGRTSGIYRYKIGTQNETFCIERCISGPLILIDNNLYYAHYDKKTEMTLYRSELSGNDIKMVSTEVINPNCVINGNIYYPDNNNYLYLNKYDVKTEHTSLYSDTRMYNPVYEGGYIYYISVDDNYSLYKYEYGTGNLTKLTKDRVDAFNVYKNVIFYQKNSKNAPQLIRINTDGSNPELIAEGNFENINITSSFTYFNEFDERAHIYRTPTTGSVNVSRFTPKEDVQ